jgi:hypothetical protein
VVNPSARKASARAASGAGKTAKPAKPGTNRKSSSQTSLIEEMKQQHREVEALLTQPGADKDLGEMVERICNAWIPHTLIEEQIIIPALQRGGANEPALAEAEVRRDLVKVLLADLQENATGPDAAAKFAVLGSELEQLIEVEERPQTGVLALASSYNVDLEALKPQVDARKTEMETNTEGDSMNALEPTSLRLRGSGAKRQEEEYSSMPYDSNVRERDERGRFESDDDRRGGYRSRGNDRERDDQGRFMSDDGRGPRSRSSRDYDDDYRRSGSNGGGPGRDEEGRFTSGGNSSRSSRYENDDRSGGDGRSQGGWFGDREGHSEASRRGWESREGAGYSSRSSRYEDDDRRGPSRGSGRGWFGDAEGHSEAAREGWEDRRDGGGYSSRSTRNDGDDRRSDGGGRGDGRGWYGDPRGHSQASREGWEDRRGGGYSSRSSRNDDDDDRRGDRGRGHGGWFGDSEGHSEASRRGWDDRR